MKLVIQNELHFNTVREIFDRQKKFRLSLSPPCSPASSSSAWSSYFVKLQGCPLCHGRARKHGGVQREHATSVFPRIQGGSGITMEYPFTHQVEQSAGSLSSELRSRRKLLNSSLPGLPEGEGWLAETLPATLEHHVRPGAVAPRGVGAWFRDNRRHWQGGVWCRAHSARSAPYMDRAVPSGIPYLFSTTFSRTTCTVLVFPTPTSIPHTFSAYFPTNFLPPGRNSHARTI